MPVTIVFAADVSVPPFMKYWMPARSARCIEVAASAKFAVSARASIVKASSGAISANSMAARPFVLRKARKNVRGYVIRLSSCCRPDRPSNRCPPSRRPCSCG